MNLKIYHRTEYHYQSPAVNNTNILHLSPRERRMQSCDSCVISVLPSSQLTSYVDLYGNTAHHVEIPEAHSRLVIETRIRATTQRVVDLSNLPYGTNMAALEELQGEEELHCYLQNSPYVEINPIIWKEAVDIHNECDDVFQTAYAIMQFIFEKFTYQPGATAVSTHGNEVIEKRQGVCQDFAHAMAAYCRCLKIPARYVSGYFYDATRDQSLRGSEATHAWVEVYLPGSGWIGFDPTNNKVVDETYVTLAEGRDYHDVAPVTGSYYGGGCSRLVVHVAVRRTDG